MGRFDVSLLQYMTNQDMRVLTAIERGMRHHELVPGPQVAQLSDLKHGGVFKKLKNDLCKHRLAAYERGKYYDGYRLTNRGYDFLALYQLRKQNHVMGVGSQFGIGKESDIFLVEGPVVENHNKNEPPILCMKLHRLGRTCFRKLKEKRDYHKGRNMSWIYLSRLSASKEFAYMTALHAHGFPVPVPIAVNRHCLIMSLVKGYQLQKYQTEDIEDVEQLYSDLMDLILKFANYGVIHGDFNEFNIMLDESKRPVILDFPQMVSTNHINAKMYFDRDVDCIKTFFEKRFKFVSETHPDFDKDVVKEFDLDKEVSASGFNRETKAFDAYLDSARKEGDSEDEEESDSDMEKENDMEHNEIESDEAEESEESEEVEKSNESEESEESEEEETSQQSEEETAPAVIIENPHMNNALQLNFQSLHIHEDSTAEHLNDITEDQELVTPSTSNIVSGSFTLNKAANIKKDDDNISVSSSRRNKSSNTGGQMLQTEERKAMIQLIMKAKNLRREAEENGESFNLMEVLEGTKGEDDRLSAVSFSTTASTVNPHTLKLRAEREAQKIEKKQVSKKNLRVKGEANAVNRHKRENTNNIKQTMACSDVWG